VRWLPILLCSAALAGDTDVAGKIREAMGKGDYAAAAALYSALIAGGQSSAELLSNYGLTLHLAGRNQEALEQFRLALRQKPDLTAANLLAGVTLVDLDRAAEALPYLQRARSLDDAGAAPLVALGKAYVALRDFANANAAYAEAVQRDAKLSDAWYGLGITYRSLAEDQLNRASNRESGNPAEWHRLLDQSLVALNRAVALAPDSPRAHLILGESLRDSGKLVDAIPEYQTAIRLAPKMQAGYLGLATTYWKNGDFDRALPELDRALELSPRDPEANAIYADILEHRDDQDNAEKRALLAVNGNPRLFAAHVVLARIYLSRRQPEKAVGQLEQVVSADPDGSYHFLLWRAYKLSGKPKEAEAALAEFRRIRSAQPQ
jgi:tetratricopeptide (TPR) repeat protein